MIQTIILIAVQAFCMQSENYNKFMQIADDDSIAVMRCEHSFMTCLDSRNFTYCLEAVKK